MSVTFILTLVAVIVSLQQLKAESYWPWWTPVLWTGVVILVIVCGSRGRGIMNSLTGFIPVLFAVVVILFWLSFGDAPDSVMREFLLPVLTLPWGVVLSVLLDKNR